MKTIAVLILLATQIVFAEEVTPVGTWMVAADDAKIEIYQKGDELEGKIVWLKEPNSKDGTPKKDIENPDKAMRVNDVLGMVMLKGFKKNKDEWSGGTIYDGKSGKTYKAWMKPVGTDKLKLRGYVGISLFGRTEEWKRQ